MDPERTLTASRGESGRYRIVHDSNPFGGLNLQIRDLDEYSRFFAQELAQFIESKGGAVLRQGSPPLPDDGLRMVLEEAAKIIGDGEVRIMGTDQVPEDVRSLNALVGYLRSGALMVRESERENNGSYAIMIGPPRL